MHRVLAASAIVVIIAVLPAGTGRALAHGSDPLTPTTLWQAWAFDPLILLPLAMMGILYGRGYRLLSQRSEIGRMARRWQFATTQHLVNFRAAVAQQARGFDDIDLQGFKRRGWCAVGGL